MRQTGTGEGAGGGTGGGRGGGRGVVGVVEEGGGVEVEGGGGGGGGRYPAGVESGSLGAFVLAWASLLLHS